MLVLGINTTIIGLILDKITLKVIGVVLSIFSGVLMQTTFFFCCHIFEDSKAFLYSWANYASRMNDGGYMKSAVKSLRPFAIPAGEIGFFDRDIKMNYIDQVIAYVTNVLLFCKRVFLS